MKFRKEIGADTILEDWTPPEVSDHGRSLNNFVSEVATPYSSSSPHAPLPPFLTSLFLTPCSSPSFLSPPPFSLLLTQGFDKMFSWRVLW